MAKSKNHTSHHNNRKDHRNGIKKPKRNQTESMKGCCPKFLRNLRYIKAGTRKALKEQKAAAIAKK
ncbi:60S ribosomal protein L29 [Galendromus occidentalis]|uniref:60S ribosomal protein L29 n=1 Tax=Galendromus occidentalis TaxID=34638 RepID=A0AAJ7WI76_9ACAR|nr:60S ribosomal protein L29 [Galendromus occidentalis]